MQINRDLYLDKLVHAIGNQMIKVVTGMRRCGKSYLLFTIFHDYLMEHDVDENHIIEVDLENRLNKGLRNPDALLEYLFSRITDKEHYYILLDEVQQVSEFEDVLNSFLKVKNVDVYVTGSNAKFLSKDVITEFRGRGEEIRVNPLSFKDKFTKTVADYTESEYYNRAWAFFNADADGNRILPVKDIYRFYDLIKSITTGDGKWQIQGASFFPQIRGRQVHRSPETGHYLVDGTNRRNDTFP